MPKPRIFVSHSNADNAWCRPFVAALQGTYDVWYDEKDMPIGALFPTTIGDEVAAREVFVVVVSPDAMASGWVQREINIALLDLTKLIIPVVLRPATVPNIMRAIQQIGATNLAPEDAARRVMATIAARGGGAPVVAPPAPIIQPDSLPGNEAPTPKSLYDLGFRARAIKVVEVIIPPVVEVPAGSFTMGSDKRVDSQAFADETPQYQIALPAFAIAKYPLTVAEYALYLRANPKVTPPQSPFNPLTWAQQQQRNDHPVVNVSWQDVVAYAAWLAQVTGQPWRLPSEAEWEKAARGTDGRVYPWGNQWDKVRANTSDGGPKTTTPVGTYPQGASPYGALDMAGNVWEWTTTRYDFKYPYNNNDGREDSNASGNRVIRGGSWFDTPRNARAAYRNRHRTDYLYDHVGFRLVRGAAAGSSH